MKEYKSINMKEVVEIFNGHNSWTLIADGKTYNFVGSEKAELFRDLYTRLGYQIVYNDQID